MTRKKYIHAAGVLVVIGAVVGTSLDAADPAGTDPYVGTYVGTFHPKGPDCRTCHATATVTRKDGGYGLEVTVGYTGRSEQCGGKTSLSFSLEGALSETNLVLRNDRYEATGTGKQILGRRLAKDAKVPTVLTLKRRPEPEKE
jgi:hypothetical protein